MLIEDKLTNMIQQSNIEAQNTVDRIFQKQLNNELLNKLGESNPKRNKSSFFKYEEPPKPEATSLAKNIYKVRRNSTHIPMENKLVN